jgi:hypothetical protein
VFLYALSLVGRTFFGRLKSNPDSTRLDGDDRAGLQLVAVPLKRRDRDRPVIFGPKRDESDDAPMRLPSHDGQFAEILVDRDQYLALPMRVRENLGVAGVTLPISRRLDLVASRDECRLGASPNAAIDEHLHVSGW